MQTIISSIKITSCIIQFRFNSQESSGIVFSIRNNCSVTIQQTQIIGHNFKENDNDGFFVSQISSELEMSVSNMQVCTNYKNIVGESYVYLILVTQQPFISCIDVCILNHPVYGICLSNLMNGQIMDNQTLSCVHPFIFDGVQCECAQGYIQYNNTCIDIIYQMFTTNEKVNNIQLQQYIMVQNISDIISAHQELKQTVDNINTSTLELQYQLSTQQITIQHIIAQFNTFSDNSIINNTDQNIALLSLNTTVQNLQIMIQGLQALKYQQTLPIGTILMFDAAGWIDNSTMTGWYACTAANHNSNNNIPNLESQFIRGISPSTRSSSILSSGTGSVQINLSNLPPHTHNMNHNHDVIINGQDPGIPGNILSKSVLIQTNQSKANAFSYGNQFQNSYTSPPNIIQTGDGGNEGARSIPIDINNNIKQYALIFIKRVK
ncbi:Conserved_hypothetical protein [Hexamita inflata]|uniref:Uncharacterized protein n=1 Tax=Hexamita inflata TaxID=28002 RepID=A0AA86NP86_9EUKA|nr:Conserved hypothetical protein [Hexamita inflata]